ncbi:MAG: HNH endonuclease [Trebonia sp.]
MAPGIQRCMYCGESLATSVDHFEPIKEFPAGTFEWLNHLLACSACNSNEKRDQFPRDSSGDTLLIDPTRDNPSQHLRLILRTGEYRALTPQGTASIQVFNLNRADLARGRAIAFETRGAVLCRAHSLLDSGRQDDAARCLRALAEEPHASVLHEMLRTKDMPGAAEVLGRDVAVALRNPDVLATLRKSTVGTTLSP